MTDFTAFPIANVTIPSLPDLGGVTDASMLVGERAGTGRFVVTALRDYVMTTVGAGYVPLTGGTMTGSLHVNGGLTVDNGLVVNGDVSASGGTLTGNLSVKDTLFFGSTGMSLSTGASYSIWTMDNGNYDLLYTRATGLLQYRRSDGVELWSVDASGNSRVDSLLTVGGKASVGGGGITYTGVPSNNHAHAFGWDGVHTHSFIDGNDAGALATLAELADHLPLAGGAITGNLTVGGTLGAGGSIASNGIMAAAADVYSRGGHYYFGNADQAMLATAPSGTSLRFSADGWALSWNASNGMFGYINNSSLAIFTIDSSGNGNFLGTVHATNVTLLEDRVAELQARIAGLERDRAELQETLSTRIAALEAQMGTGTAD